MKQNEKLINEVKRHTEILGNVETATNIISEGPFSGRGVIAVLCCSSTALGYWQSTNPLPAVITAANGNRGAKYINHNKMTIDGNTPQVGDYFRAVESQGGTPTGDHPNGESSGLIYRVQSVSGWDLGTTYNFPSANGCPSCPGISSHWCPQNGYCTEVPGNNAPYATYADCPCKEPDTFNCETNGITSNCVPVQGAGGQYATIGACQADCSVKSRKICAKICASRVYGNYYRQELCQDTQSATISSGNTAITTSAGSTRTLTITSTAFGGGATIGHVPSGGTAGNFLQGDGSWAAAGGLPTKTVMNFTGDGSDTGSTGTFTLTPTPSSTAYTDVYNSGVYQQKNSYSLSGGSNNELLFTTAPPVTASNGIEVVITT